MGTRNLTCVVLGGEYKVAQYCQWDGYPEGQGAVVLDFLSNKMDLDKFVERLEATRLGSNTEIGDLWKKYGADDSGFVTTDVAEKFKADYPQLSRDMGAAVLEYIQDSSTEVLLGSDIEFAKESLYCEWAYVIDLDKNTLEVYEGFNKSAVENERFAGHVDDGYGPVKLVTTYSLDGLPSEETFIADLTEKEELTADDVMEAMTNFPGDEISDHIANYIKANMDDFLEAIED